MELKQLQYFVQIVKSGSLSSASGTLHIAQPALSRHVRALEEEFGVQILVRTGRGVDLTPAGQQLLVGSSELIEQARNLSNSMARFRGALAGEATIGLPPTIGKIIALPLVREIAEHHPMVDLRLVEGFSGIMLEWLKAGRIDAAVIYQTGRSSDVAAEKLAEENLHVIMSPALHDAPDDSLLGIDELSRQPLVLPTAHHGLRQTIDAQAENILRPTFQLDSLQAIIDVVKAGLGWTILPKSAVRADLDSGQLRAHSLADIPLRRVITVVTGNQRGGSVPLSAISRLIRKAVAETASHANWKLIGAV